MKDKIFNEMMVHIPLNTHANPKDILLIGNNSFEEELSKYNVNLVESNADIIIATEQISFEDAFKKLKDDGLVVCLTKRFKSDKNRLIDDLKEAGKYFWIVMPYRFNHTCVILASKKYHPQADIVLQRSDLLDDLVYYSSEIHNCAFVLPRYMNKELLGIIKR